MNLKEFLEETIGAGFCSIKSDFAKKSNKKG